MKETHTQVPLNLRGNTVKVDDGVDPLVEAIHNFQFGTKNYPFDTVLSCIYRPDKKDTWVRVRTHLPQLLEIVLKEAQAHTFCDISHHKVYTEGNEYDISVDCSGKTNMREIDRISSNIKRLSC